MKLSKKSDVERYLIKMLDEIISVKDITYEEFNHIIPFGEDKYLLRKIPDLCIARYGTPEEGISTVSLLASVTSILTGKKLAVILQDVDDEDEDKLILGFTLVVGDFEHIKFNDAESYLIQMLDEIISVKDITYDEFNHIIPFGEDKYLLRKIGKEYPELGIARYGTPEEGISTFSLLASITSVLIGKRLAVIIQEEGGPIIGFKMVDKDHNHEQHKKSDETKGDEGMVKFEVKCVTCKRVFSGDTEDEARGKFERHHESINKTGIPLWVIKNGENIMHGTKTAAEIKADQEEYTEKNLNEDNC
ncbi:MAG: hypothetical protein ACOC5T_05145 [Elusimicrobiota bacterium]